MLVRESIEDVLKPKDQKQIIKDVAQEIMLDLLEGSVDFYYSSKPFFHCNIMKASETKKRIGFNKEEIFNSYNNEFGPGLYVMINILSKNIEVPMKNIYPNKIINIEGKDYGYPVVTIQYNLPPTELETAIRELVAQVVTGKIKNGFVLKYFNPNEG